MSHNYTTRPKKIEASQEANVEHNVSNLPKRCPELAPAELGASKFQSHPKTLVAWEEEGTDGEAH